MKKWNAAILLIVTGMILTLTACGSADETAVEGEEEYQIYYLNKAETRVSGESFYTDEEDVESLIDLLLEQLARTPEDAELRATLLPPLEYRSYFLIDGRLNLDFGIGYKEQIPTTEVLVRAAIVRTLCQIEAVEYVSFTINDDALLNQSGSPVGVMSADLFVENDGSEINAYETAQLTLYFADVDGQSLKRVTREEIYNSNISMEKLVVDKIITGPTDEEEDAYPSVDMGTKVLSVTVRDGICYVNLDTTFLTQVDNVTADVTIYSLVNSLTELNNVNKVQISIDGQTNVIYKESIPLENPLERNYELVKE